jgi:hypothetical protein
LSASIIANIVLSSVVALLMPIRTMHAWSTDTGDESGCDGMESETGARGLRARWRKRSADVLSGMQSEVGANSDNLNQMAVFDESEMQCKSLRKAGDFEIQDVAGDELLAEVLSSSGQSGTLSHHIQRQAIANTDMSVFKFPWEKGRLAKIFTDQPIVKMRVPKLQPGRRNLLEMSVQVSENGSVSARLQRRLTAGQLSWTL